MIGTTTAEREWAATSVFYRNQAARKPVVVNVGGARSSKSYSIAQLFIVKFFTERKKSFLTTRKTFPALRMTAYKVAIDLLKGRDIYRFVLHNKSEKTLYYPPLGNYWVFTSIDDPEKIKSTEFNYVHMEEANEFTYEDFRILKLRMSGQTSHDEINQIFISFNPSDEHGWVKQELLMKEHCETIHSTYLDNPFLPRDYVAELESLKDQDETYWKIYGLGQYAEVKELVYGPLTMVDAIPEDLSILYGLDFGFNNPTVLVRLHVKEWTVWLEELIYQSYLTNSDLIKLMKELITPYERKRAVIYADTSEPDRIEEIGREGFNIIGASKEVLAGILFVKRFKRFSLLTNENINREFCRYKWLKDREGHVTDQPLKFEDHGPDAVRYGLYSALSGDESGGFYFRLSKQDVY